ncbi:hypothetical protein ACFLYV_02960 [Chloroflexota bacterium]
MMMKRGADGRSGQEGSALILVLVSLLLGSMLITPTIGYAYTGLVESRVSEKELIEEYSADAVIEYVLWQLQYDVDGITEQLDDEDDLEDSITVNGVEVPVNVGITQSQLGEDWPFPVPSGQSGIYLDSTLEIQSPYYDGQTTYFPHTVYMYNSGGSVVKVNSLLQILDPQFTYVEESYDGFPAELTETYVDDHWELYFDVDTPLPNLTPGEATFVSFMCAVDGDARDGTFSSNGSVGYAAFDAEEGEVIYGEYSPSTIGFYYDIEATVGGTTILVNVGITEDGELVILSYHFP